MSRKILVVETAVFFIVWFFLMFIGRSGLFLDPGTFLHTVVGQHILSSRQLFYTDIFTYTYNGQPWIAQQWLGACLMALVHQIGSLDSLLVVTATVIAGLYAWIARRLASSGIHYLLVILIILLSLAVSSCHFHVRPHIVSIFCLAWVFSYLVDIDAGLKKINRLFWLIPIFVIWTNIHGGVMGGLATILLCGAGWVGYRLLHWENPLNRRGDLVVLGLALLACSLTVLVNPYGWELPRVWWSIMRSPVFTQVVNEHQPAFKFFGGWLILAFGVLYILALAGAWPKIPRVTWLIPLVWLALAFSRVRHAPLFAITATIALGEIIPQTRWLKWLAAQGSEVCRIEASDPGARRFSPLSLIIPAVLLFTILAVHQAGIMAPVIGRGWAQLNPYYWPVALIPQLQAYGRSQPEGTPIFNENMFGGFLIYYTPRLRVFVDDRFELYGDEGLMNVIKAEPEKFHQWAAKYGFEMALIASGSKYDRILREARDWQIVGETKSSVLFQKK